MKGYIKLVVVTGMCILVLTGITLAEDLEWECISREIMDVTCVLVSSNNPRIIYIGTKKAVFKSRDAGDSWQIVLRTKGENPKVNFLLEDSQGLVYAATGEGLFKSPNQGANWQRLFRAKVTKENDCQSIIVLPDGEMQLGTKSGLFISKDNAKTWQKSSGRLKDREILAFAYDKHNNIIYLAAEDGVYKIIQGQDYYKRIFVAKQSVTEEQLKEDRDEDEVVSTSDCVIRYIEIDPNRPENIYLATNSGVYKSSDYGQVWEAMPEFGLLSKEIKFLLVSKSAYLYALSKSGVFVYKKERWEELSLRLPATDIRSIALDNQGNLYAATNKGLFKTKHTYQAELNMNEKEDYFADKPTIQELHQAAIKYAQVIDPERIEAHRKGARIKALLPEFSLDYDKTVTAYSSTNSTRYTIGPWDWGVSLSWNLSDLIWSEQQRLIDSQLRLMVQLRNDILDEVTKLYFERRRLKIELLSQNLDSKKRAEKELKIEEINASLDALTGSYLSKYHRDRSIYNN